MEIGSPLTTCPDEMLRQAISIMATNSEVNDQTIDDLNDLTKDKMLTRRLIAWIPEALGHYYLGGLGLDPIPASFSAGNARGKWIDFPVDAEPLYRQIVQIAPELSDATVILISRQSSAYAAVKSLTDGGGEVSDAQLTGAALVSIPAAIYGQPKGFLSRLFGG